MKKVLTYLLLASALSGCSMLSSLSSFLPGGDGVNANAQVGAENTQAIVSTSEEKTAGDNAEFVESETVNEVSGTQVNNNSLPWWVWVLIGWMIPTPSKIICDNIRDMRECRGRKNA